MCSVLGSVLEASRKKAELLQQRCCVQLQHAVCCVEVCIFSVVLYHVKEVWVVGVCLLERDGAWLAVRFVCVGSVCARERSRVTQGGVLQRWAAL